MAMENKDIKLNVGGSLYTTSRSTLTCYPDSMLGKMFIGSNSTAQDEHGRYIIDGDGPIFRYVLNFLRRSKLILPEGFKEWDLLAVEAEFYKMTELKAAVVLLRKQTQKMEFIEIGVCKNNDYYYIGKEETLEKITGLHGLRGKQNFYENKIGSKTGRVIFEKKLCVIGSMSEFEVSRMLIFEQIASLGFEMVNTVTTHPWLFKRKL